MEDGKGEVTHDLGCGWIIAIAIVCFTILAAIGKVAAR